MEPLEEDYYEILQVHLHAGPEVIDAAFKKLAQKYHPDVNKDPATVERMKKINVAHDILSNPDKRKSYDLERLKKANIQNQNASSPLYKAKAILQIDNKNIQFSITSKVGPPPQTVNLTNVGIGLIEGDVTPRQPWIVTNTRHIRFYNTYKIQIQVDTSRLSRENVGVIDINTNGGTDSIMIKVVPSSPPIKTIQAKILDDMTYPHKCAKDTVWYNPRLMVYECRACLRRSKHRNNIIR